MGLSEARKIVLNLANGVDPTTGEVLAEESPYNDPEVIRALYTVHGSYRSAKPEKMTTEERQQENTERGRPRNAGLPWTDEAREEVASGFHKGSSFGELAKGLERSSSAIRLELIKQGLVEPIEAKAEVQERRPETGG